MIEEWKSVIGYEHDYLISSFGEVKSLKQGKEKLLKKSINTKGTIGLGFVVKQPAQCYLYMIVFKKNSAILYCINSSSSI